MKLKLCVIMDPIKSINYKKDSTLALLFAAQKIDFDLYYAEQQNIYQLNGVPFVKTKKLEVCANSEKWYNFDGNQQNLSLSEFNVILMRKDPPFDMEFIYTTYMLEQVANNGVLVVNNPQSLRDCNEKMFATIFADLMPATLVSRDFDLINGFCKEYKDVILKPLDGMGGAQVFRHRIGDPNLSVILETLTNFGARQIMVQQFISAIKYGDKRIIMIDGYPVPYCLARIPAPGETRGNLAAGGTGVAQELSDSDKRIAERIGPILRDRGLILVGLDVIGDKLTEINVTSPTCLREIDYAFNTDIGMQIMLLIKEKVNGNLSK